MEQCLIENLYDLSGTIAAGIFEGLKYPWEALPLIGDFIKKLGPTLDPSVYEQKGENIWIAKSATIAPSASITGPCIICENATLRQCAFVRGNAIVGEGATVGNSTELKNVILFRDCEVPHYNYVGDSILGVKAHLGAGAKFGAMLGDHVEVGCNSVLNPGTVIGRWTNIYPLSSVRGVVPEYSIYKSSADIVEKQQ